MSMRGENKGSATGWVIYAVLTLLLLAFVFSTTTRIHWDVIGILAGYALVIFAIMRLRLTNRGISVFKFRVDSTHIVDLLLAMLYSLFIFKIKIHTFFDDAGFLLRYLDHFSAGYFFTYNLNEGPVLGISSFLYGLVCGLAAMTHLLDNDTLVLLIAFTANVSLAYVLLKIAGHLFSEPLWKYLFWACVLFGTKMYFNVAVSGMETPLHLTIVFAAFLYFLKNKPGLFFFFSALSIISKLDAVPVIALLGLVFLFNNKNRLLPLLKNKFYADAGLYFILPLSLYVITTFLIFGSPLPQSAYAKMHLHQDTSGAFFPYLNNFIQDKFIFPQLLLFATLILVHIAVSVQKGFAFFVNEFMAGRLFLISLVFYYFYNPAENMSWYYALPGLLMLFQLNQSIFRLISKLKRPMATVSLVTFTSLFLIFNLTDLQNS